MSTLPSVPGWLAQEAIELVMASTVACLIVLALRVPVRRLFGARAAYALWWLLPAFLLAVLLPAPGIPAAAVILSAAPSAAPIALEAASPPATRLSDALWLGAGLAWALGAITACVLLALRQRRFRRSLGRLQALQDGLWKAEARDGLPAVLGLRARIVLPADFDHRYAPEQRALVLAHERIHRRRGDVHWNFGFALLCALYWFNPVLRLAQRAFRLDQELACDARVLAAHPQLRRRYGEALLDSETSFPAVPLGCPAFGTHPLKERILMLTRPLPSRPRLATGFTLALLVSTSLAGWAWAQQTPRVIETGFLDVQLEIAIGNSAPQMPRVITAEGQPFSVRIDAADGTPWSFDLTAATLGDGRIGVIGEVLRDQQRVSQPSLQLREGEPGRIAIEGDRGQPVFSLGMTVRDTPSAAPPAPPAAPSPERPSLPAAPPAPPAPPTAPVPPPAAPDIAASYRRLSPPEYPASAKAAGQEGTALLRVTLDSAGTVQSVEVEASSGAAALDRAAVDAVHGWLFNPAQRNGEAVASEVRVPVQFLAAGSSAEAYAAPAGALDTISLRGD